ncbi:MAG: RNA methyltransferase [Pseudomonadota bacterium]
MAEFTITAIGALGDGLAKTGRETVFIPFTLPGEVVEAREDGKTSTGGRRYRLETLIKPAIERQPPICSHFGMCGGCALQHYDQAAYLAWKRQLVVDAFASANIETDVASCIASSPHSRRRVVLSANRTNGALVLGFHARASSDLVAIEECPILLPEIEQAFSHLRALAPVLLRGKEELQIAITACDNGLDLDFRLEEAPNEDMMAAFVRAFARTPFLRASLDGDIIVEREKPKITFGDATVELPSGGFSQAVASIENAMGALVCQHLKKAKRVADLFSGSGTFALRLSRNSRVHAVEMEKPPLAALIAASGGDGLKSVTVENRDLHQLPLMASELKPYDGLCLDPPRAGAELQVREIAKSAVSRVSYVSCNPVTLARDSAHLIAAGFTLKSVTPLDQFLFSHHVEVVALFERKTSKAQRPIFARR